jgi:hypothetical protein
MTRPNLPAYRMTRSCRNVGIVTKVIASGHNVNFGLVPGLGSGKGRSSQLTTNGDDCNHGDWTVSMMF